MSVEEDILEALAAAVRDGRDEEVEEKCLQALRAGVEPTEVVREGLCRGMRNAGELYERNEYFLPELLLASEAMHSGIRTLSPFLRRSETTAEGEAVVLGVVEGDVHEIGKNLVAVMLEAEGYRVIDLGFDVSPSTFTEALERSGARILALSTMMTTTLPVMRLTVELARKMRPRPIVVVGGAPLTPALAKDMGADGYGENAAGAPALLRSLSEGWV
ncbi:MAG: cobalamin B12-binding domain-containing protein [Actinomycetota bacterium]